MVLFSEDSDFDDDVETAVVLVANAEDNSSSVLNTEAQVVTQAMRLLVDCIRKDSTLLAKLYEFPDVDSAFTHALLRDPEPAVRSAVQLGITELCDDNTSSSSFFLTLLLASIDDVNTYATQSAEYFNLLNSLLGGASTAGADESESGTVIFDVKSTAEDLATRIQTRRIVERTAAQADLLLRGLMQCTSTLLSRSDASAVASSIRPHASTATVATTTSGGGGGGGGGDGAAAAAAAVDEEGETETVMISFSLDTLLHHLFHDCLFAVPSGRRAEGSPPKCKTRISRKRAFALLGTLARLNSACWGALCELALPQHPMPTASSLAKLKSASYYRPKV
jgi:hypothetical protein